MIPNRSCATCRFFRSHILRPEDGAGWCNRFPPTIINAIVEREMRLLDADHDSDPADRAYWDAIDDASHSPVVSADHLCGEWQTTMGVVS
jgi:hypothetical protein